MIDPLEVISGVSLDDLSGKLSAGNLDPKELERALKTNAADYPGGIPACGSDALRFGLLSHCGQGRDVNLDINRVVGYRNFCNKLWNATRFAFLYFEGKGEETKPFEPAALPDSLAVVDGSLLVNKWILSRLAAAVERMQPLLAAYQIAEAATVMYEFWYKELCDVYLESIKPVMQSDGAAKHMTQSVLYACMHNGLRLLHPFMPFVTEELYQRLQLLAGEPRASVMVASYPEAAATASWRDQHAEDEMELVMRVAEKVRSVRSAYLKGPLEKHAPAIYLVCRNSDARVAATLRSQREAIGALAKSTKAPPPESITLLTDGEAPPRGCVAEIVDASLEVHVMLKGVIDFSKELVRLEKERGKVEAMAGKLKAKMSKPDYTTRCPAATQEEEQSKLVAMEGEIAAISTAMEQFQV